MLRSSISLKVLTRNKDFQSSLTVGITMLSSFHHYHLPLLCNKHSKKLIEFFQFHKILDIIFSILQNTSHIAFNAFYSKIRLVGLLQIQSQIIILITKLALPNGHLNAACKIPDFTQYCGIGHTSFDRNATATNYKSHALSQYKLLLT